MKEFVIDNHANKVIRVGIEPWAQLEELKPGAKIIIEYEEPAEINFSFTDDGGGNVDIVSGFIKVIANGKETIYDCKNWK